MVHCCPFCFNLLFLEDTTGRLQPSCKVCPSYIPIKKNIVYRNHYKLKETDDALGGAEAWKNVDSTEERCPKCSHPTDYFTQLQTRSADDSFLSLRQS